MRDRLFAFALGVILERIKNSDGHAVATEIADKLTSTELIVLSGTIKEAEWRRKEMEEEGGKSYYERQYCYEG